MGSCRRAAILSPYFPAIRPYLILSLLMLGSLGAAAADADGPERRRPNILLLVIDTLRADHCSSYGYPKETTPFLDKMAAEGVRFARHFSGAPWTTPSLATLFTGRPAAEHGLDNIERALPAHLPTLAGDLRRAGYYTLGVLCNPCAAGRMGFSRGFDRYDDFTIALDLEMNLFGGGAKRAINDSITGPHVTRTILKHLAARPLDKPWFVFALYFDPHHDYVPTEEYRRLFSAAPPGALPPMEAWKKDTVELREAVARYDAEIRQTDDEIAALMDKLRAAGHFGDDDLLVWTADHGEEFREHGGLLHGRTYFDEAVHVPLALRWPGRLPAGRVVEALTSHEDVAAALSRAAGIEDKPEIGDKPGIGDNSKDKNDAVRPAPAADIWKLATGETDTGRSGTGLSGDDARRGAAWRADGWLIVHDGARRDAYDLVDDPGQQNRLDPTAHPESRRLENVLSAWREAAEARRVESDGVTEPAKPTPREIQTLKSLGYLQ